MPSPASFLGIHLSFYRVDKGVKPHNLFHVSFKSTTDHHEEELQSTETTDATSTTYEIPNSGGDYMPLHPSTRSWEISREQVDIIKSIGKGAFSQVAKATVKNVNDQEFITVAVKMLKGYGKLYFKFIIKVHIIWLWFVANITPALTYSRALFFYNAHGPIAGLQKQSKRSQET